MKKNDVFSSLTGGILADCYAKIRRNFYEAIDEKEHKKVYYGKHPLTYAEPEFSGKYLDICTRYYEIEGDENALKKALTVVDGIAENQREDGHITSYEDGNELKWFGIWNHAFTLYGLTRVYEVSKDAKTLSVAERAADFLIAFFTKEGAPDILDACNQGAQHIPCLYAMCRMYQITGKKQYLDFVSFVLSYCEKTDMNLLSFRDILSLRSKKGIEMLVVYLGVLSYGLLADDAQAVDAAKRYWQGVRDTQIRNTGNGTIVEFWTENGNAHRFMPTEEKPNETCVAVGWCELSLALFFAEPRAEYLDALEKTVFNHMIGSLSSDGTDFAYYQGNYGKKIFRKAEGLYQCCRYRGYTLFSCLPSLMFYDDGARVIPLLYGSCAYEKDGLSVEEITDYPKNGTIRFRAENRRAPVSFLLRVPAWCESYTVSLNGAEQNVLACDGFLTVPIPMGTSEIALDLAMPLCCQSVTIENEPYLSYQKGPLLLALDTRFGGAVDQAFSANTAWEATETDNVLVAFTANGATLVDFASAGRNAPEHDSYTVYLKQK